MFDPKAVAIVGMGAILPDALDASAFWKNIKAGHYAIRDVPPNRWRVDMFYDPDPSVPDKTYSKIGGWVNEFPFEPLKWGIPIPPSVLAVMDDSQKWGISTARQALYDYGYPKKSLDLERVAVIIGNALAGENHYITSLRIHLPEFVEALQGVDAFHGLPAEVQQALVLGMQTKIRQQISNITEDTMPGELGNVIAGRIANVFNLGGPNFITDAACASSLAAVQAAIDGLTSYQFDAVLTGGVDRNMGIEGFVKFCKIGALSPDGSRPFADGANGFVMGEGAVLFLLKRLADAERDGDQILAVIRGIGASSDGKGKGITAPNPIGQQRALERAWKNAGVNPASVGLIEAHGTSTRVGDVVEVNSLNAVFGQFGLPARQIALGSVKSNVGHLKSAAGAVGMLKAVYALHEKVLPPSANFHKPNPNIDFDHIPFYVNTEARPWENRKGEIRRAGVSSFGFGGTNFHMVLEEWVPGLLTSESKIFPSAASEKAHPEHAAVAAQPSLPGKPVPVPYRGLLFIGGKNAVELKENLTAKLASIQSGILPPTAIPSAEETSQPERLVIDYSSADELINRAQKALKTLENEAPNAWQAMTAQGVYRGSGKPGKLAFLFPGQGSQYVNMLKDLCEVEPVVADTFKEADRIMEPILGRTLTSYIYVDGDEDSLKQAEAALRDTAITQPAMLTANVALLRLMDKFGFQPDYVIGHSLGEYAALVASGVLTFAEALEVVSARGREMKKVSVADNGGMVAVSAPLNEVERIIQGIDEYIVIANINSPVQSVVGGSTAGIEAALAAFQAAGFQATKIPVSHAFHTKIVAPASVPLKQVISRMNLQSPKIPVVANVTGQLYPTNRDEILEILGQQVASPVQFIKGMETLYAEGVRVYAEIGPKRVMNALANDIFKDRPGIGLLATNHPRKGAVISFNEAFCALLAAGIQPNFGQAVKPASQEPAQQASQTVAAVKPVEIPATLVKTAQNGFSIEDGRLPLTGSVVISGAGLGLPGRQGQVFSEDNIEKILQGDIRIESLPVETRESMLDKRVTRLEKSEAGAQMVSIDNLERTVKLGGQRGEFDLANDFGVPAERTDACDIATQLAIAAGIDALRDAGVPLVMAYRQTSKGTYLPDRWRLPEALADETGVIFASAFPGLDRMAEEADRFYQYKQVENQYNEVKGILSLIPPDQTTIRAMLRDRLEKLEVKMKGMDYHFDRRFIFRVLAMGHSQFAEHIGARGPNTHVNAACATTTHAIGVAEDWIRAGRCRRVVIIAGDDVSGGSLSGWIGTGLMASGAATTEGDVRMAALPFDRRRNGMIMGMGAAALVVESEDAVRERGMRGICEILSTQIANSAFHGTRLDVPHVREVMNRLVQVAETRFGVKREEIAPQTMFMSHETYTPARGGSASAEINALRYTFGEMANKVIIANTKGFTGHTMGVGVEDVVAVKALEHGRVPPIANYDLNFQPDPELGDLNLSKGGEYPLKYALRLGAGFGSQIAMALFRVIPGVKERVNKPVYQTWLANVAGYHQAELEVEKHTLRIKHMGQPVNKPAKSAWQYGQGPTLWADRPGEAVTPAPKAEQAPVESPAPQTTPAAVEPVIAKPVVPVAAATAANEDIQAFVLNLVSEKTGYPIEMLDLELDLEADLGIDTVKQAEIFATIRTHYNIPRREDLRLVDYNTLQKVIAFMQEGLGAGQGTAVPVPAAIAAPVSVEPAATEVRAPVAVVEARPSSEAAGARREEIQAYVLEVVSEKTGYPAEMLDLELDLEADLGIDTVKQAELFATIRTHYEIPRREDLRLVDYNTLEKVIGFMMDALGSSSSPDQTMNETAVPAAQAAPKMPEVEAVVEPQPAGSAVSAASASSREIEAYVLQVVSEKTGYPVEMLDLGLDLEADLGIDTVKQAELFATIRTHYEIPRREDLRLVDYNTLEKVIGFMVDALQSAPAQPATVEVAGQPSVQIAAQEEAKTPVVETALQTAGGENLPAFEEMKDVVLSMVAEKTGYPAEMLDLDLDLEADLGIDTVKQAELFASIRTHYSIPRREDLRLADYNTLAKVIQFMREALQPAAVEALPEPEASPAVVETEVVAETTAAPADPPVEEINEVPATTASAVTIRRNVPVAVLRPRLDVCLPTGVALEEGIRIVIVADQGKVADSLARRLRGRKAQVLVVQPEPIEAALEKINSWQEGGSVDGLYYLPALDSEPSIAEMDLDQWQAILDQRVMTLYHLLRNIKSQPFLVCATRLGGLFGYGPQPATAPFGGAVSGFVKALSWERHTVFTKVVDFQAEAATAQVASRLIEETLRDPGVVEVGWEGNQRFSIAIAEREVGEPTVDLGSSPVFLVSGGTGGITTPIILDLAQKTQGRFVLLGRSALPDARDADLQKVKEDPEGFRKDLFRRMAEAGSKPSPAQVDQELAAMQRAAATVDAIEAIQSTGGQALYLPCDLTDAASVKKAVQKALKTYKRVDVLIHAAGFERSRKLESKPEEEFRATLAVKASGFFYLYKALLEQKALPKAAVLFSSVAGRFGNSGQTDYCSANDLLCKLASSMRAIHPESKVMAIDWSAWAEVGMASRGYIPKLMELGGIDLMPPAEAAPRVFRELTAMGSETEIILSGSLGTLAQPRRKDGGLDVEAANHALTEGEPIHVMLSRATGLDLNQGILLEAELDPNNQPFLKDHALNGIPLLPGVMGIEGFSIAAKHVSSVLGSEKGGFEVDRLEDIQFLAPFKFYRGETRRITWKAQVVRESSGLVAHVSLESTLAGRVRAGEVVRHFSGKVHLVPVETPAQVAVVKPPDWNGAYTVSAEDIYRLYFHGPAFQVLDGVQRSGESVLGKLRRNLPEITENGQMMLTTPVLLELCLQTAGIWEVGSTGTLALPRSIGSLNLYQAKPNGAQVYAEVHPSQGADGQMSFDARVIDASGNLYLEVYDYRTAALPYSVEAKLLQPLRELVKSSK